MYRTIQSSLQASIQAILLNKYEINLLQPGAPQLVV